MKPFLHYLLLLLTSVSSAPTSSPCCNEKQVGDVNYILVSADMENTTTMYGCMDGCVYEAEEDHGMEDHDHGARFCFKSGSEPVTCLDGPAHQKTLPWFFGMDPLELCVETGTEVVFNKTGHNVVLMANQADYDACTGFLGENPTVGNNIDPFIWQADTDGTFYFACGVGTHCSAGGMKAKITVAPKCSTAKTLPWTFGMQPLVVCVETGTEVIFDKTGSGHNVNQLASASEYNGCTGFTDTQGNSDNPFLYQADTTGVFYFACGVGSGFHCNNGGMKAMVTVADTCPEE